MIVNEKRVPLPASLSTQMRPPSSSASWRQIARPSPVPPYLRVVDASTWLNEMEQPIEPVGGNADAGVGHREAQLEHVRTTVVVSRRP